MTSPVITTLADLVRIDSVNPEFGGPGEGGVADYVDERLRSAGIETRRTVLGYLQRGGTPSAADRVLATRFGSAAATLLANGEYGKMVALKGEAIVPIPVTETAGKTKTVPLDHPLLDAARAMGTCFGSAVAMESCLNVAAGVAKP